MNGGEGMNGTKYAPGDERKDLWGLLFEHGMRIPPTRTLDAQHIAAIVHSEAMLRPTSPENFYAIGTDLRAEQHPVQLDASAADAERILRNHRRMAHRAWTREIAAEHAPGSEVAACRAWMVARLHCGLPT